MMETDEIIKEGRKPGLHNLLWEIVDQTEGEK